MPDPRRLRRLPIIERIAKQTDTSGNCWEWRGSKDAIGYGKVGHGGRYYRAHRLMYELFFGPFPKEMVVCHSCDNRSCINPLHLFLGTQRDNVADAIRKGRHVNPPGPRIRSHCPHGHEYSGANLIVQKNGHRKCRECKRLDEMRRRAERRRITMNNGK